jgi:hypothetical protein
VAGKVDINTWDIRDVADAQVYTHTRAHAHAQALTPTPTRMALGVCTS